MSEMAKIGLWDVGRSGDREVEVSTRGRSGTSAARVQEEV